MMIDELTGPEGAENRPIKRVEGDFQVHLFAEHLNGAGTDCQMNRTADSDTVPPRTASPPAGIVGAPAGARHRDHQIVLT